MRRKLNFCNKEGRLIDSGAEDTPSDCADTSAVLPWSLDAASESGETYVPGRSRFPTERLEQC